MANKKKTATKKPVKKEATKSKVKVKRETPKDYYYVACTWQSSKSGGSASRIHIQPKGTVFSLFSAQMGIAQYIGQFIGEVPHVTTNNFIKVTKEISDLYEKENADYQVELQKQEKERADKVAQANKEFEEQQEAKANLEKDQEPVAVEGAPTEQDRVPEVSEALSHPYSAETSPESGDEVYEDFAREDGQILQ